MSPSTFAAFQSLERDTAADLAGAKADARYWRHRATEAEFALQRLSDEVEQRITRAQAEHVATVPVPMDPAIAHCQQPGATVAPTLAERLEPIAQPWTWRDMARAAAAVLLLAAAAVACTGCGGGDASADDVAEHDAQSTVQPVACAASGCAR